MRSSWVLAGLVLLALVFGGASAYEKCPNCGLGEGVDPCNCGGTVVKAAKLHKPSLVASPEAINYALKYQEANGVYGQPIPGYGAPVTAYGAHAYGAHSAHAYGTPCKSKAPFVNVLDHESRYEIGDGGKTYEELQQLLYRKPGTSVAPLFKPVGDLGHPDRMGKYFGSQYAAAGPHKIVGVTPAYPGKTPCKCPPPAAPKVYGTPSKSYAPAPAYGAPAYAAPAASYAAPAAYAPAAYPKPAYGAPQPAYAAPKSYGAVHHAYPAPKPYEAHQPRPAYQAPKPYGHPASYSAPSAYPAHKPQAYGAQPAAYSAPAYQAPKPYAPPSPAYSAPKPYAPASPAYSAPKPYAPASPAYSAPKPYAPASPAYSAPKPYAPASPAYSAPKPYGPHPAPYAAPAAYSPAPKAYAPAYPAPAYPAPASYAAPAPAAHKPAYPAPPTVYSSTSAAYPAAAAPAYAMAAPAVSAKPAYSKTAYSATSHYGHDDDDEALSFAEQEQLYKAQPTLPADPVSISLAYKNFLQTPATKKYIPEDRLAFGHRQQPADGSVQKEIANVPEEKLLTVDKPIVELKSPAKCSSSSYGGYSNGYADDDGYGDPEALERETLEASERARGAYVSYSDLGYGPVSPAKTHFIAKTDNVPSYAPTAAYAVPAAAHPVRSHHLPCGPLGPTIPGYKPGAVLVEEKHAKAYDEHDDGYEYKDDSDEYEGYSGEGVGCSCKGGIIERLKPKCDKHKHERY